MATRCMTENSKYSDDHLTAYLDGELDPALMEEIRLAIQDDRDVDARLNQLRIDREQLASAMDQLLTIAPAMPDLPIDLKADTESRMDSLFSNARAMAAGIALLIAGGIGGFLLNQQPANGWKDYVAAYHMLYVNSTLTSIETNPAIQVSELGRVSAAIAKPIALENVTGVTGLDYKRAQVLGFKGKPLAQMTFLSKMGEPIALCIIRTDAGKFSTPAISELEGMAAASWAKDGYAYLLIGGKDQNLIEEAAQKFDKIL